MSAHISFSIQPMSHPSKYDFKRVIPFSEHLIRKAYIPIDTPTNPGSQMIELSRCLTEVSYKTGHEITQSREKIKQDLLNHISHLLDEAFQQHDLVDGYSKKEQLQWTTENK